MLLARVAGPQTEPTLFQTLLFPSASDGVHEASPPMQAESGPSSPLGRRQSLAAAEEAFATGVRARTCVFDVLTTGDLEAMVGAY
jgi:hypothetical protein